jgi:hypothetical protein
VVDLHSQPCRRQSFQTCLVTSRLYLRALARETANRMKLTFTTADVARGCANSVVSWRRYYKVVQIWPGQTVTCLHTYRPGHIWTALYNACPIQVVERSKAAHLLGLQVRIPLGAWLFVLCVVSKDKKAGQPRQRKKYGWSTRWFKYDRDDLCVNKSQFVPVIFEPPCTNWVKENVKNPAGGGGWFISALCGVLTNVVCHCVI